MAPVNDKGEYFEDENFVKDPTDFKGTLATHGRSGHMDMAAVSDVFLEDRRRVAQAIVDDEADLHTDESADEKPTSQEQTDALKEKAQAFLDETDDGLSDSQRAAAEESDADSSTEPTKAAQDKADSTKSTGGKTTKTAAAKK